MFLKNLYQTKELLDDGSDSLLVFYTDVWRNGFE